MGDGAREHRRVTRWMLAAHACRTCLGRILDDGDGCFVCSGCGEASEFSPDDICGCGLPPRRDGTRFRCTPNPDRAAIPAAVVIGWAAAPALLPSSITEKTK